MTVLIFLFFKPTLLFVPASMLYTNHPILDNLKEVVKECIAGNRGMQNKFYKYYASRMMGVCLRYSKSRHEAEEILQEGFIKVFTCMHQYKFKGSLEGWIKRTMINCALQKIRSKSSLYPVINIDDIMTHREIAEILHIAEGTSKSNLHDARIMLQKQLGEGMQMLKTKM